MPKGVVIRKPQPLEMHATMFDIPEGADVLEAFTEQAEATGYMPLIILSGTGRMSRAVLEVPNDEALTEITEADELFGVKICRDGNGPELEGLPVAMTHRDHDFEQLEAPKPAITSLPHWSSTQTFDHPVSLIYAHGARAKETSPANIHFIMSGSKTRPTGISETFVGRLLPGCIAASPMQFVVGIKPTHSNVTVQARTISVEPGYELLETIDFFLKTKQDVGKCFILSATGKLSSATIMNINEDGAEEAYELDSENGSYYIEDMTGIICPQNDEAVCLHAAIVLNCGEGPCDSVGGRLTRAVASSEGNLDIYLGEMTDERDMHAPE